MSATKRSPPGGGQRGTLDGVFGHVAKGWAVQAGDDQPAVVEILVDGAVVGSVVADTFREDLKDAGIRNGYAHFAYPLSMHLFDGETHTVSARHCGIRQELGGSPRTVCALPGDLPALVTRAKWAERELLIGTDVDPQALAAAVKARRRVAILCTYHGLPAFLGYHELLATTLERAGFVVVIVHASGGPLGTTAWPRGEARFFYLKRNIGYDFGSWAFGVYQLRDHLSSIDELILVNDSNILLHTDLLPVLDRLRGLDVDVSGLTDSYERSSYHLQSYLLRFSAAVCRSAALPLFMAQYPFVSDKGAVIERGELLLTKFMLDAGFSARALIPYERVASRWLDGVPSLQKQLLDIAGRADRGRQDLAASPFAQAIRTLEQSEHAVRYGLPLNPTHVFWDTLIESFGYPFLKRELVTLNPAVIPSYFRLSDLLASQPPHAADHVLEVRRRYGGKLIPFVGLPSAAAAPDRPSRRPRERA